MRKEVLDALKEYNEIEYAYSTLKIDDFITFLDEQVKIKESLFMFLDNYRLFISDYNFTKIMTYRQITSRIFREVIMELRLRNDDFDVTEFDED